MATDLLFWERHANVYAHVSSYKYILQEAKGSQWNYKMKKLVNRAKRWMKHNVTQLFPIFHSVAGKKWSSCSVYRQV